MRIGIDASRAFQEQRTGIEEYSFQVITHLIGKLEGHQVVLYVNPTNYEFIRMYENTNEFKLPQNWKIKVIRWPRFWTQIGLSLEMLFHSVDVLFIPSHTVPLIHPKNTIVTVHGLEYELMPEAYSFWEKLYMYWSIRLSCRWAKKIIAVSKNTKKDLMNLYNVPEEKIRVVYEGVSENFKFQISNFKSISNDQFSIQKPYLLFIGRLEERKNVEGIMEAFEILKEKYNIPHKLILAGKPGYGFSNFKFQISNFKNDIILPGFVSEEEKLELLKNADVFLFPSFYEGFGLPVLEAQAVGVPVVSSNVSSLPEVGGDSVAYCIPEEPASIVEAIRKILDDKEFRDDIIKKGYDNTGRFSWEKCTEEISKLF